MDIAVHKQKLEAHFTHVLEDKFNDVPIVNHDLRVEACGFRLWNEYSLCIMCTPWFMSLLIIPEEPSTDTQWKTGQSFFHSFPSGEFEFTGVYDDTLGAYQSCSLFSPMFEFTSHEQAVEVALAAMEQLFEQPQEETENDTSIDTIDLSPKPVEPTTSSENISRRELFRRALKGGQSD